MQKQSFFFVLKKEMYDKLFEGKIPSLKDFTIGMYRFYDSVADKLKNYSYKSDTEFIIFEVSYTKDEFKEKIKNTEYVCQTVNNQALKEIVE